jgi:hypothetical protein
MMDEMFEMPSKDQDVLEIELSYAVSKIEKTNVNRLKIA